MASTWISSEVMFISSSSCSSALLAESAAISCCKRGRVVVVNDLASSTLPPPCNVACTMVLPRKRRIKASIFGVSGWSQEKRSFLIAKASVRAHAVHASRACCGEILGGQADTDDLQLDADILVLQLHITLFMRRSERGNAG